MAEPRSRRVAKKVADNVTQLRPPAAPQPVIEGDDAMADVGDAVLGDQDPEADLLARAEAEDAQQAERPGRYVDPAHTLAAATARAFDLSCKRTEWLWAVVVRPTSSGKAVAPKPGETVAHDVVLLPRSLTGWSPNWAAWRRSAVALFDQGRAVAGEATDASAPAGA